MLDRCIQHAPTLLELYTVQCKILKHAGDPEGAAAAADKARSMDLADRCCRVQIQKLMPLSRISQPHKTSALHH